MARIKDIKGLRVGKLLVLEFAGQDKHYSALWKCQCDCGNIKVINGTVLRSGVTRSCSCLIGESNKKRSLGSSEHELFQAWWGMIKRCTYPKQSGYERYGGRGIRVCERWRESFANFLADMGERPEGTSLDRIDNDGDYCKENCRWATVKEQSYNRSTNRLLTFNDETRNLTEWALHLGINPVTLNTRIQTYGWEIERALTEPVRKHRSVDR